MAGPLPGVGALLIPVALMLRGNEVMMVKGTRFTAVTDEAVSLKWEAVVAAQAIEVRSKDNADVYIYRAVQAGDYGYIPVTCGEQFIGMLENGRFIHLRLPHGTYFLQAGSMEIRLHKVKPERMFQLGIEAGKGHYVEFVTEPVAGTKNRKFSHFKLVDEVNGAEAMTEMLAPGTLAASPDIGLEPATLMSLGFRKKCYRHDYLPLLQAQVGLNTKAIRKASEVEVACTRTNPASK